MDMSREMPTESQWDLLEEYGLNSWFDAAWIDVPDTGRAAACFRADPDSAIPCDLDAAFARVGDDTQDNLLWIGAHSSVWSVAVAMSGSLSFDKEASAAGRRIFTHKHMAGIYELGNEGMLYYFDGKFIGTLGDRRVPGVYARSGSGLGRRLPTDGGELLDLGGANHGAVPRPELVRDAARPVSHSRRRLLSLTVCSTPPKPISDLDDLCASRTEGQTVT